MPEERAALWFPMVDASMNNPDKNNNNKNNNNKNLRIPHPPPQPLSQSQTHPRSNVIHSKVLSKQTIANVNKTFVSKLPVKIDSSIPRSIDVSRRRRHSTGSYDFISTHVSPTRSSTFVIPKRMGDADIETLAKEREKRLNREKQEDKCDDGDGFLDLDLPSRSLTPIPENKETNVYKQRRRASLDSSCIHPNIPDIFVEETQGENSNLHTENEFHEEVDVTNFSAEELRFVTGRNHVRIIGEKKPGGYGQGFHKVVTIPSNVDPLSVKTSFQKGMVIVTGSRLNKNRKWTVGRHGLMTVKQDGSTRVTLDLPDGMDPKAVRVKTVTKTFLVVCANDNGSVNEEAKTIESYELPPDCDTKHLKIRVVGNSTVVIEVSAQLPQGQNQGQSYRPRSFTY